jgi:hypothetical protein
MGLALDEFDKCGPNIAATKNAYAYDGLGLRGTGHKPQAYWHRLGPHGRISD